MTCTPINLPGGGRAIVCGPRRKVRRCACGRSAALLCDWKVPGRKSGTCDKPVCDRCTTSPAPDKDLCAAHGIEFEKWKAGR
jgi:hypothetical protein